MSLRLGVAEIDVIDLDAAWQFYVDTLGIPGRSIGHGGEVGAWGVGRGGPFELDLGEGVIVLVYRASVPTPSTYPNGSGVKLVFFADDIVKTVAAWRAKGVEFIPIAWSPDASGIASSPFGPFIAFRDPFDHVHELLEPDSPSAQQESAGAGYPEPEAPTQLDSVLAGFPTDLVAARVPETLTRFCVDLDAAGRLHSETSDPVVDEHALRALLRPITGEDVAVELVTMLGALPEHRLRSDDANNGYAEEAAWFRLADRVVIYDIEPESTLGQLSIAWRRGTEDLVEAVRAAFPSLERELIDPRIVPPRIVELIRPEHRPQFYAKLVEIDRQLGWWAALVAVLLAHLATMATTDVKVGQSPSGQANAWPLGVFVMAAAVGGWTMTVVESVLLAP